MPTINVTEHTRVLHLGVPLDLVFVEWVDEDGTVRHAVYA